jgi:hypothetical protein
VGQIIYVVSKDTQRIVPLQVCEEIRRKTTSGEEVTYLGHLGPNLTEKFDMKLVKGDIFDNLDAACNFLRKNFENFLTQQSEWTLTTQKTWYTDSMSEGQKPASTPQSNLDLPKLPDQIEELWEKATNRGEDVR